MNDPFYYPQPYDPYESMYGRYPLSGQIARQQQAPQQQGGGIDPLSAYNLYSQFSGSSAAGSSAAGSSTAGGGSSLAALGPWAALAAVIAANETWANKEGRRPDDFKEHMGDLLTGKVLQRDMDALGDKIGGPGGDAVKYAGKLGNPSGLWDASKDGVTKPVEWVTDFLSKLF